MTTGTSTGTESRPLPSDALDALRSQVRGALLRPGDEGYDAARRIQNAVGKVLTERRSLPPDLGGNAGTREMAAAIVAAME